MILFLKCERLIGYVRSSQGHRCALVAVVIHTRSQHQDADWQIANRQFVDSKLRAESTDALVFQTIPNLCGMFTSKHTQTYDRCTQDHCRTPQNPSLHDVAICNLSAHSQIHTHTHTRVTIRTAELPLSPSQRLNSIPFLLLVAGHSQACLETCCSPGRP